MFGPLYEQTAQALREQPQRVTSPRKDRPSLGVFEGEREDPMKSGEEIQPRKKDSTPPAYSESPTPPKSSVLTEETGH